MTHRICFATLAASLLGPLLSAQMATHGRPATATGQCKDGTYTNATAKMGACRGHNGVRDWYNTPPAPTLQATPAANPAPQAALQAAPQPVTNNQQPATSRKGPKANLATTPAAPGGAPNLVWLNAASSVYHCYGTDFYGKTKSGSYLTEADAKARGAHGNRGATCAK